MSSHQVYALMKGGRIYTLRPLPKNDLRPFRWIGFCDGDRCGFYKSKADFEAFVSREPDLPPLGPHADATFRAEAWSTFEGNQVLQMLGDRARNRKE